jgi:hypothetical protein
MGTLPVESLPNQFDVVWCFYPRKGDKGRPGPVARPTLVLDALVNASGDMGSLIVAYGTDNSIQNSPYLDDGPDLIIETMAAAHALGLHKPTRFSMSPARRRQIVWSDEYFAPQPYRKNAAIVAGILTAEQIERVKECFRLRRLEHVYWSV